jgi:MFS family permease
MFSCTVASMLSLTIGITLAIPSNVILELARGEPLYRLTTSQQSVFAALGSVGAIFSGLSGGWVADHWGRKCSLMFTGVPFMLGYLIVSYAHFSQTNEQFVLVLYAGRLLTGVGMGSASAVFNVYVTEVVPPKLRGLFGT